MLLTTVVVPKIFPYLNVVGHLAVPAGSGSYLLFCVFVCKLVGVLVWLRGGSVV